MESTTDADDLAMRLPDLREFAAVGQDKAAVARLYAALLEDLDPQNLVERMWIRDIAVLTIRSEELRLVQLAVHKVALERSRSGSDVVPAAVNADGDRHEIIVSPGANGDTSGSGAGLSHVTDQCVERVVGQSYADNLEVISTLAEMETSIRKDRDRILNQFNLRRRSLVQEIATAVVEAMKREL